MAGNFGKIKLANLQKTLPPIIHDYTLQQYRFYPLFYTGTIGLIKDYKKNIEKVTKDYKIIYKIKEENDCILDNLENIFEKIYNQITDV